MPFQPQNQWSSSNDDQTYSFTAVVMPCGKEEKNQNSPTEMPYEITLIREQGEQHNLKKIVAEDPYLWHSVY
jgi:hypothetical protein